MNIVLSLSALALQQVVDGACAAVGVKEGGDKVVGFLTERFTDHSQRLGDALQNANERAWKALEVALAGDSLWDRCKVLVSRGEDKAFGQQVRAFLDSTPLPGLADKPAFRQKCLEDLRAARKKRILTGEALQPRQLAKQTADFARFGDPTSLLEAEWRLVAGMASEVKQAGYPNLAWLLSQRPSAGQPLLIVAVRYFFRRSLEEDQKLFQGLSFARLEALGEAQERGFAALSSALSQQGRRLEELLGDVKAVVVQTHSAVLDLQGQIEGQSEQIRQIGQAVLKLLDQHQLQQRELRPADSMSIRSDGERQLVKQLVARYRALPEEERQRLPALLNAVGKLEVVTGDFVAAQQDFQQVATLVVDTAGKAEAHFNAYRTALERRDWSSALRELLEALKLDAKRFSPFPVGKYHPQRILGAGGFGVAFSCRHKELKADVVVKTLLSDDLAREVDEVFNEARVLYQLDHPAIIRLLDCGYTIPGEKTRPYFVMNFFDGVTLEEYVQKNGTLAPEDLLGVARLVAEGLEAAHGKGILHRDVKPANLLVRKDGSQWQVKIIDFGLALKQRAIDGAASTAKQGRTIVASSIAGTVDYGSPEQMGRLPGVVAGPQSDVYGWAKTCCFALFKTTQPLPKHWKSLPEQLAKLLEDCLEEDPKNRPQTFAAVIAVLSAIQPKLDNKESSAAKRPAENRARDPLSIEQKEDKPVTSAKRKQFSDTRSKTRRPNWVWLVGGMALLALVLLLSGIILRVSTKAGVVVLEIDQPGVEVFVDDKTITLSRVNDEESVTIQTEEGTHELKVTKGGFQTFTKRFTMASRGKKRIKVRLEPNRDREFSQFLRLSGRDYVEVATSENLVPLNGTFTAELWVRLRPGKHYFLGDEAWKDANAGEKVDRASGWEFRSEPSADNLTRVFEVGIAATQDKNEWFGTVGRPMPVSEQWQHLAVCKGMDKCSIHIDGKLYSERRCEGVKFNPCPGNFFLGVRKNAYFNRVCNFDLAAFRLSSQVLYSKPFSPNKTLTNGADTLVLFDFTSGKGRTAPDKSGKNHHGTIVGAVWCIGP